ncbi:hypothetical protein AB0D67_37850 [Streptosporangium sp. NPDC048047]|uniref:hypothetical protein n=1 Tax=Streptosporangium sp. NPDC048047 TaxID=3155748 RepID=UPI003424ADC0
MAYAKTTTVTHVEPHANWGPGKEPASGWPGTGSGARDAYDAQQGGKGGKS